MKRIVIVGSFATEALLLLSQNSNFEVIRANKEEFLSMDVSKVDGLLIRSGTKLDKSFFSRSKQLQVVVTATSGFDHIDIEAATQWGVTVMHCPDAHIDSTAQLTWSLALACARKTIQLHRSVKAGEWNREGLRGIELSGKTYGVVGLGRIGRKVCSIAQAFDMKIVAYDPYQEDEIFRSSNAERVSFEECLKRSDILSFHVPKTRETKHMINRSTLEFINRGIILINTSRGGVFQETDLLEALQDGTVAMAGLDVFEKEPLSRNSSLLQIPNIVLTPHMGAQTTEAFNKASDNASMKILRFFLDGMTSDTLPPKTSWYELAKSLD